MPNKTIAELQAEWITAATAARSYEELAAETYEFRYKVLATLLAKELKGAKTDPIP
jgi:hypothetical protein